MKVYISGKITGLYCWTYLKNFLVAEIYLREQGYSAINPAEVNGRLPEDTTYEQYMQMSMLMLSFCDAIYMLENWKDSPGAIRELEEAKKRGLKIMYQDLIQEERDRLKRLNEKGGG